MAHHAKLSPSSAHRWMNCPGSVRLTENDPNTAGQEAMRGTAAHKVIETMLLNGETDAAAYHNRIILVHGPGEQETQILEPGNPANIIPGWFMFVCDDTMVAGVQTMIDEIERVREELFEPLLYTERFLDMTWLDSRLGGTADVTLVELGGWIHLFDYKNGRIVVEVVDNEQMKNYAVGLLHEHPDAAGVHVHLVQPNAQHEDGTIRDESYTADEIRLFEITLKEAADATTPPNAPRRAGEWCTYCSGKERCPEFAAFIQEEVGADFADDPPDALPSPTLIGEEDAGASNEDGVFIPELPEMYTDGDEYRARLVRVAKWIPLLDQLKRDVLSKIQAELLGGNQCGDWKLVRGKSNRKWIGEDEAFARELAKQAELRIEFLYEEPKLKSPAKVEKLGDGKEHRALVKRVVKEMAVKPPGKIAIAPGSDTRDPIDPATVAAEDFADDPAEDFTP